jgi:hypothetical protein
MIIKLDTSVFRLGGPKAETAKKTDQLLSKAQWINADRVVMAVMFIIVIIGSILF